MPIITKEEVFLFCGAPEDVQTTQADAVDALIVSTHGEIQNRINRALDEHEYTNLVLGHGANCIIQGATIYLMGLLRDTHTVDGITENGVALEQYQTYENKGNYMIFEGIGSIQRSDGKHWSTGVGDITISGTSQFNKAEVKQAMIEIVGIKSGLWKKTVMTEGGAITTDQSLSKPYAVIDKYIQVDIF